MKHETFKHAVKRYKSTAGDLFKAPSEEHSSFEKNTWMLCDDTGELVCIVDINGAVFGQGIVFQMQKLAESFAQ